MLKEDEKWNELLRPSPSCLRLEEIAGFADGTLDEPGLARAGLHIESCSRCATELDLYRDFASPKLDGADRQAVNAITSQLRSRSSEIFRPSAGAAEVSGPGTPQPRILWFRRKGMMPRFQGMALAAAVLLLAVGIYVLTRTTPEIALRRVDDSSMQVRSARVALSFPVGDLQSAPTELRWLPVQGAARYQAEILEVDQNVLWQTETASVQAPIPESVRALIVPRKKLFWQVRALDAAGRVMTQSGESSFRVR